MSKWVSIAETPPPLGIMVLVTDGDYVGLARRLLLVADVEVWRVPGISGYEWDFDEPTHWQEITLPEPPKEHK